MAGLTVSPDGARYVALARGERLSRPFHFRWLIPTLCGESPKRWQVMQRASLLGMLPAAVWFGGIGWQGLFVAAFVVGCAGVWRFGWTWPVLVDAPAMLLALLAAASLRQSHAYPLIVLSVLCALLAGATKETSPVFAALWCWSPIPLIGLLAPAVRMLWKQGSDVLDDENRWILDHPFKASRKYHAGFPPAAWVLPWGVGVVALAHVSWPLALTLAAAYAQCAIATDTVRLYQWAWPVVALGVVGVVPVVWLLPLAVVHAVNPFAGDGL